MASIDRLSGLPDELICHTLSFLPTKLSVATSALAKRWRFLWAHVPNLVFEYEPFKDKAQQHLEFMHRVMMLHEAKTLNTFSLSCVDCTMYQLEMWITYASQRSVRSLHLEMCDDAFEMYYDNSVCSFPKCLLACKTLVDLRLYHCRGIPSSGKILFPSLKKLDLSCVLYEDDKSLPLFLSGCPVLEKLIINYEFTNYEYDLGCIDIYSPTIKSLKVGITEFWEYPLERPDYMVIINAPALRYLKLDDCSSRHVTRLTAMTYLIEADFCFYEGWHHNAAELYNCLSNLKCLTISHNFNDKLIDIVGVGSKVKLDNLTKLEIGFRVGFGDLVRFLEVTDNLEVLILAFEVNSSYREPKRVPTCMLSRLRTIQINCFDEHDFDTARYLLRNAKVLERMKIYSTDYLGKLDVLQKFSLFEQRWSKSCQIDYY